MDAACPLCGSAIAIDDVNVATDIALCRRCGKSFPFSQVIRHAATTGPDLAAPPEGAWLENTGYQIRVGATTRSWTAFIVIPFTCAWSGMSLYGIYGT